MFDLKCDHARFGGGIISIVIVGEWCCVCRLVLPHIAYPRITDNNMEGLA